MTHHHRSGPLKQRNKKHKTGNHKSKALVSRKCGGKVDDADRKKSGNGSIRAMQINNKQKRMLRQKQLRDQKKQNIILSRRYSNCSGDAPRVVALIGLAEYANLDQVHDEILREADELEIPHANALQNHTVAAYNKLKQKLCVINCGNHFMTALDAAKVADTVVFVLPLACGIETCVNAIGENILTALRAQGLPAVIGLLQGLENLSTKAQSELKKYGSRFFQTEFGEDVKITTAAPKHTQSSLSRILTTMSPKVIHWREARSYMLGAAVEYMKDGSVSGTGTVRITGYLRGKPLSVNQLIHITDVGTFQMSRITTAKTVKTSLNEEVVRMIPSDESSEADETVLAEANKEIQEDLQYEAEYDPFSAEQTWPTEEEIEKVHGQSTEDSEAGMSQYQSAWVVSDAEIPCKDEDGDEVMNESDDTIDDDGDVDQSFCKTSSKITNGFDEEDNMSIDENDNDMMTLNLKEKRSQERENMDFPDEVDVPVNTAAKTRFARYRGVKSLRTSTWDPKESLPADYARLFQFEDFASIQRRALGRGKQAEQAVKAKLRQQLRPSQSRRGSASSNAPNEEDIVMHDEATAGRDFEDKEESYIAPGKYVTLEVTNVPFDKLLQRVQSGPLTIGGLLRHENRLSVLNFNIQRATSFSDPLKSKEPLTFHVGFRRYRGRPVYSDQNLKSDLHRFHRFLPQDGWSVASVYGPTTFQPATALLFHDDRMLISNQLVATGTLKDVNPDRVVLKRVILTGTPVKVKKRKAVIRHMFHSPEDVRWFKPVELTTKHGLTGHIKEPLGTHGDLKAIFNKPIKQHDTVCLALYKRVYPKFCDEI